MKLRSDHFEVTPRGACSDASLVMVAGSSVSCPGDSRGRSGGNKARVCVRQPSFQDVSGKLLSGLRRQSFPGGIQGGHCCGLPCQFSAAASAQ